MQAPSEHPLFTLRSLQLFFFFFFILFFPPGGGGGGSCVFFGFRFGVFDFVLEGAGSLGVTETFELPVNHKHGRQCHPDPGHQVADSGSLSGVSEGDVFAARHGM